MLKREQINFLIKNFFIGYGIASIIHDIIFKLYNLVS